MRLPPSFLLATDGILKGRGGGADIFKLSWQRQEFCTSPLCGGGVKQNCDPVRLLERGFRASGPKCCWDQKIADPEKCFRELISEKLLVLLWDKPCLELIFRTTRASKFPPPPLPPVLLLLLKYRQFSLDSSSSRSQRFGSNLSVLEAISVFWKHGSFARSFCSPCFRFGAKLTVVAAAHCRRASSYPYQSRADLQS